MIPFLPSPRHSRVRHARTAMRSTVEREQRQRTTSSLGEMYATPLLAASWICEAADVFDIVLSPDSFLGTLAINETFGLAAS